MWAIMVAAVLGADPAAGERPDSSESTPLEDAAGVIATAVSTGLTTGRIGTMVLRNRSEQETQVEIGPALIPAVGRRQGYVIPRGRTVRVPGGGTRTVPLTGYCTDVHRPPVERGDPLPVPETWITEEAAGEAPGADWTPPDDSPFHRPTRPSGALVPTSPGEDDPFPYRLDTNRHPEAAAPFLLEAARRIEDAYDKLKKDGKIRTPFSRVPERERDAVVQQTLWVYSGALSEEKYEEEDFKKRMEEQYEEKTGQPITAAPERRQESFEQGSEAFWDSFALVGEEAKVLTPSPGETQTEGEREGTEVEEEEGEPPVTTAEPEPEERTGGCTPRENLHHTPNDIEVEVADSYGDEEKRGQIVRGMEETLAAGEDTYMLGMSPSTVFALWGHDHVGGHASAFARTIMATGEGTDFVWSTDSMEKEVSGTGSHTLSFVHGPECSAVVAGGAVAVVAADSEAFDPMEEHIEVVRAIDFVKKVSVKYAAGRLLPPGVSDLVEEGVEAITDPSSDTWASARGTLEITVGGNSDSAEGESRVVYKREELEDESIIGGEAACVTAFVSDVRADSLTSRLSAEAEMGAGAQGNGLAEAKLESAYGTLLVGVCECPQGSIFRAVTDMGMFVHSRRASAIVSNARQMLEQRAQKIGEDLQSGALAPDGASLKARAEKDLREWARNMLGPEFGCAAQLAGE